MARPAAPQVEITEAIQPQARTYDTMVRPAAFEKSPMWEVAAALKDLAPKLAGMFDGFAKGQEKDAALQGEAAFWMDNQDAAGEATRSGAIPNFANPGFETGYKKAQGTSVAMELHGAIGEDYATSSLRSSNDPNAFDQWFRGRVQERLGPYQNDPKVLAGIMPHLRSIHSSYYSQWIKDRQEYQAGTARDMRIGEAGSLLDGFVIDGAGSPGGVDIPRATTAMQHVWTDAYKSGMERDAVVQVMTDAIVGKAILHKDPKLLTLLDTVKDSNGIPLSSTEYGKNKKLETHKSILTLGAQEEELQARRQAREDKKLKDQMTAEWAQKLYEDPSYQPTEEWLRKMDRVDPDFRKGIVEWRRNILGRDTVEDPKAILQLHTDIYNGAGPEAVTAAIRSGTIKTHESYKVAMDKIKSVGEEASKGSPILKHPSFTMLEKQIIQKSAMPKSLGSLNSEPGITQGGRDAIYWAKEQAIKWSRDNPNASDLDREQYLKSLTETTLRNLSPPEGAEVLPPEGQSQFVAPPAIQRLPVAPTAPLQDAPVPAAPSRAQAPAAPNPQATTIDRLVNSPTPPNIREASKFMSPEQEAKLRAIAKQKGVDPQVILNQMHQNALKMKQQFQGTPGGGQQQAAPGGQGPSGNPVSPMPGASTSGVPTPNPISLPGGVDPQELLRNATLRTPIGDITLGSLPPEVLSGLSAYLQPVQQQQAAAQGPGAPTASLGPVDAGSDVALRSQIDRALGGQLGPQDMGTPSEEILQVAARFRGLNETDNREVLKEFLATAHGNVPNLDPKITPWCARFANAVLSTQGKEGTGKDTARSFLRYGVAVEPQDAQPGDIVVFPRGKNPRQGHVGFIKSIDPATGTIEVLGGNQGGRRAKGGGVTVQRYNINQAIGIRRITRQTAELAPELPTAVA